MRIESDRTRVLGVPPEELWAILTSVGDYQRWWPWLDRFEAVALEAGARWRCVVRAPLGYPVRFDLVLQAVEPPRVIVAELSGDILGEASVGIEPHTAGSLMAFHSALEPSAGHLRLLGTVAPWMARRGHDAVIDSALRQFDEHALG